MTPSAGWLIGSMNRVEIGIDSVATSSITSRDEDALAKILDPSRQIMVQKIRIT